MSAMTGVLERLLTVDGVRAAAIYESDGACLAVAGEDADRLRALGSIFLEAFDTTDAAAATHATIVRYERGTVVMRCVAGTAIVLLTRPELDLSDANVHFHINVALRVVGIRRNSSHPPPTPTTVW